ncbi:MAG TPA: T9SS type A sorting domain-containing protein [Bacteroidia bacterium]|nr:T9SS type A sorting domain-containing protein [Bacteroidia bacterium]
MKRIIIFTLLIILSFLFSFAQKETNNWYFGSQAGINFSGGAPVAMTNGSLSTTEGCTALSDANGNLLFYSDGIKVYNSNHSQMPNGFGLLGYHDATQTALIVKKPGSNGIYYLFTVTDLANPNGIRYSIIDMSLNGGSGDVTIKNVLLQTPSTEKMAAVKHKNGTDVWIVTHDWLSDAFRCFLLTSSGVSTLPVLSNAGLIHNGSNWNTNGYLKISPDGKKIALAICHYINKFELFDFDNSTGIVSNVISFPTYPAQIGAYGVEFSRDGTKLYGSLIAPGTIYQFDLCAGSPAAIINSATIIGSDVSWICALQLGPDGKIYVARSNRDSLGVINNPNAPGMACNYVNNGLWLGGNQSQLGLPSFESSYLSLIQYYNLCFGDTTFFNLTDTTNVNSVFWEFDDPGSGIYNTSNLFNPYHLFSSQGTYTVQLIRFNSGTAIDTLNFCITIASCPTPVETFSEMHPTCSLAPNPNNGFFKITVDGLYAKKTEVTIFDCTGKKGFSITEKNINGSFSKEINLSQVPAGIYIVKILSDEFTRNIKMVLADE